jgi:hypothetical protein
MDLYTLEKPLEDPSMWRIVFGVEFFWYICLGYFADSQLLVKKGKADEKIVFSEMTFESKPAFDRYI